MTDKKLCPAVLLLGHAVGIAAGAAAVCVTVRIVRKHKCGMAGKAKQAFRLLEKTLSV